MPHKWRPSALGEIDVVRAVRRARIAGFLGFLSYAVIGLALGATIAECFTWLRTAHWGGPYVFDVYRALHFKLPHSEWPGMAKAIAWTLVQPFIMVVSVPLFVIAGVLRMVATIVRPFKRPAAFCMRSRQILLSPIPPAIDPRIAEIEEAYRRVDTIRKPAPSEHRGHDAGW